jgi:hypothetical protein
MQDQLNATPAPKRVPWNKGKLTGAKRKPLVTLRDAVEYITNLPRKEQNAEHWRPAATLLAIIGERGGCMFFAERAVAFGLRKGAQTPPPEPDPSKKTTHWGKRKLKRDE